MLNRNIIGKRTITIERKNFIIVFPFNNIKNLTRIINSKPTGYRVKA
jgi:hypothetical protein